MSAAIAPFYGFAHMAIPPLHVTVRPVNIPGVGYRYVVAAIGDSGELETMCLADEGARYITAYYARRSVWEWMRKVVMKEDQMTVIYRSDLEL